jgi:hypothetical protein
MDQPTKPLLGSNEYLEEAQNALESVLAAFWKINNNLPRIEDDLTMAMSMMAWPVIESGHSMLVLSGMGKLRDCFILARPILEHILNIGYFGAKGTDAVDKALRHSHQKAYRDLKRELTIKDFSITIGLKDIGQFPKPDKLRESLDEFTNEKGFEVRAWTGDSTHKKIEIIGEKYGKEVAMILTINLFYIYRHSSEVIHGTLFGAIYSRGMANLAQGPPINDDQFRRFNNVEISFILINTILLIYCISKMIHAHYPMEEGFNEISNLGSADEVTRR